VVRGSQPRSFGTPSTSDENRASPP
jgi:hypothetical protein